MHQVSFLNSKQNCTFAYNLRLFPVFARLYNLTYRYDSGHSVRSLKFCQKNKKKEMVTFLVKLTQSESSFTLPGIDGTMICTLIKFMYVCMYVLLVGNNVLMILYLYDLVFDKI